MDGSKTALASAGEPMISQKHIEYIVNAHQNHARKPGKAFRKHDGKTPYWIHPIWCATTILTETSLDEKTKNEGAIALLYHDVLEDTTQPLPQDLNERIKYLVEYMTFESSEEEMQQIWQKPREVRLYKLYDKVSNLLDGNWMQEEKMQRYKDYIRRLSSDVESNYGKLNIVKLAKIGVRNEM